MMQKWGKPSGFPRVRPVLVLRLPHHVANATGVLLLLMQVEGDEKKAKTSARAIRRQSAGATAAIPIVTDKLGEFQRRVDIVASFLALNHDARTTSRLCS
eukprot:COSAG02_NODE_25205_length_665_cov_59.477032_1_plen_99_part_01